MDYKRKDEFLWKDDQLGKNNVKYEDLNLLPKSVCL